MTEKDDRAHAEQVERTLAASVSWGLPAATLAAAIAIGAVFGVGPAILVVAAGALVGVIGLLWASLRTLAGDAPLSEGLAAASAVRSGFSNVAGRKRRALRALKDMELEHALGKIDDRDYAELSARYREEAKGILREMDVELEPLRPKAEALARAHLEKAGLLAGAAVAAQPSAEPDASAPEPGPRMTCSACGTSNEKDAAFCKKCRARLARARCAKCGTSNEPDATFCKKCGAGLESEGHRGEDGSSFGAKDA